MVAEVRPQADTASMNVQPGLPELITNKSVPLFHISSYLCSYDRPPASTTRLKGRLLYRIVRPDSVKT